LPTANAMGVQAPVSLELRRRRLWP
jgi:hypothetical protein